jgi:GTP-binding protein
MIDLVKLLVRAGSGGHGKVAFRREKYVPKGGPNGGNGGDGGNVYLRASSHVSTLSHLAGVASMHAKDGGHGQKKQMSGTKGEDLIIDVPVGTIVWQLACNQVAQRRLFPVHTNLDQSHGTKNDSPKAILRAPLKRRDVTFTKYYLEKETESIPLPEPDTVITRMEEFNSIKNVNLQAVPKIQLALLAEHGQQFLVAQGGFGGRGNESFKAANQTTPLFAEYGTFGEERLLLLELQLLADVGLVGLPNAGKSTFLSRTTKANPRIAAYPFTTLEPQLGVWSVSLNDKNKEIVLADIPGLIKGASAGEGLGYDFLRHIQACKVLVFVLSVPDEQLEKVQSGTMSVKKCVSALQAQLNLLVAELKQFNPELEKKESVVVVNKIDLLPTDTVQALQKQTQAKKLDWLFVSADLKLGFTELAQTIVRLLNKTNS